MRRNEPSFGAILEPRLESSIVRYLFARSIRSSAYPRDSYSTLAKLTRPLKTPMLLERSIWFDSAHSYPKTTARRYDVGQRLTATDSCIYLSVNKQSATKSVLPRTALVPPMYDAPPILHNIAHTRIFTGCNAYTDSEILVTFSAKCREPRSVNDATR